MSWKSSPQEDFLVIRGLRDVRTAMGLDSRRFMAYNDGRGPAQDGGCLQIAAEVPIPRGPRREELTRGRILIGDGNNLKARGVRALTPRAKLTRGRILIGDGNLAVGMGEVVGSVTC